MKLPPLPDDDLLHDNPNGADYAYGHTDKQMQAYGVLCARAALEEAADKCSDDYHTPDGWGTTRGDMRCVELIKSIKIEETP